MRTKTLILTAALSAAGVATSMAQVYSVNAVGYVNTTLKPGYNLISNPLIAANNTIGSLFQGVPNLTQVSKFVKTEANPTGSFVTGTYSTILGRWNSTDANFANMTLVPGEGVFVRNPGTTDLTVTFVGEVPQGTLSTPLPQGLSIVSSQVPQSGTATDLGLPVANLDQVHQWDPAANGGAGGYRTSTYSTILNGWSGSPLGTLKVGEAFFFNKRSAGAGTWTRTFSVNQ
ncbi:MAG: hypothetical protein ACO1QB_04075 [Verrucomicrobiales bacterium]